jgi:hypothetical protein
MERCSWKFISHTTIKLKPLKKRKKVCSSLELTNEHYLTLYFTIIYIIQSIYTHSIDISFLFHSYFIHVICGKEEHGISERECTESGIKYQVSRRKKKNIRHLTRVLSIQIPNNKSQIPNSSFQASSIRVSSI